MSKRLRVNVIFSFVNALVTLLFPLITYPYVSRVLEPEGMGAYNIAFSIMSYFLLFANLGIPMYGIRAVAKARDDENLLRKTATEILILHAITTTVIFCIYNMYVLLASNTQVRFWVYFITGFHILSTFLNVEWYYQGREEYGLITIKNFIVKIISLFLIFAFVNDKDDLLIYAAIMIFSVLAYGIVNFIHFFRIAKPSIKGINIKALLKPVLLCFILYAASRLASGLDVIMIDGLLGDSAEYVAGQYGIATKFVNVIIDLLLVINTVMLPRLSLMIKNKSYIEAKRLSRMVQELMLMFVLPATVGLIFISKEITLVFFGEMYQPAIATMMVMSGNAFLAVFTNFFGIQILYAYGKDWFTTVAILVGAIINIVCNLVLIPRFYQLGAAIATIISNSVIFIIELIGIIKWKYVKFVSLTNLKSLIATIVMTICLILIHIYMTIPSLVLSLVVKVLVAVLLYVIMIIATKHEGVMFFINELKNKTQKIKKSAIDADDKNLAIIEKQETNESDKNNLDN